MLNKVKLGPKLIGGFLLVSVVALIIGVFGIANIKKIETQDTFMYEKATIPLEYVCNLVMNQERMRGNTLRLFYENNPDKIKKS